MNSASLHYKHLMNFFLLRMADETVNHVTFVCLMSSDVHMLHKRGKQGSVLEHCFYKIKSKKYEHFGAINVQVYI
jgi:hypothetical protein